MTRWASSSSTGNVRNVSSYNNVLNEYFSTYISEADRPHPRRDPPNSAELYRAALGGVFYLTTNTGQTWRQAGSRRRCPAAATNSPTTRSFP